MSFVACRQSSRKIWCQFLQQYWKVAPFHKLWLISIYTQGDFWCLHFQHIVRIKTIAVQADSSWSTVVSPIIVVHSWKLVFLVASQSVDGSEHNRYVRVYPRKQLTRIFIPIVFREMCRPTDRVWHLRNLLSQRRRGMIVVKFFVGLAVKGHACSTLLYWLGTVLFVPCSPARNIFQYLNTQKQRLL